MGDSRAPSPEQALLESEERFRTLCEHAPVMIDSFDDQGHCTVWNRQCERMLGWTHAEIQAMDDPLRECYPDKTQRDQVLANITKADGTFREYEVLAKDGTTRRQMWADFRLPNGALISVGHDVTDQRILEAQLRHTQKLDALGQLSGGISHDFNNLLTVIMVNTQLLEQLVADIPAAAERAAEVLKAARRGGELVRKLMAFGRKEMLRFEHVDVVELVTDLSTTLRRLIPERIEIVLDLAEDTPPIRADAGGVEQMIVNLATNARDAIADHGHLHLTTFRRDGDDGPHAVIAVIDDGVGANEGVRERMFDPFFTTKAPGEGSGLGLSMVYGLMKQHDGTVEIKSTPDSGTRAELRFPVCTTEPSVETVSAAVSGSQQSATILVVEDERAIRAAASAVLSSEGYRVLLAGDGAEALKVLEQETGVDMIISDVVMPKMGGVELYRQVRNRPAAPKFVLTSGYPAQLVDEGLELPVLPKPWTLDSLLACVRDALS